MDGVLDLQLGDFAVNPLLVADEHGTVLYANRAMAVLAGCPVAPGSPLPGPSPLDLAGMVARALTGETVQGAQPMLCDGRRVVVISLPVPDDASEHARLVAAQLRWRAVFDNAPLAIVEVTFDGVIVAANMATSDLTGRLLGDVVGRSVYDLFHRRHRRALAERIAARAAGARGPGPGMEMQLHRPDGEDRWVRARGSLLTLQTEPEGRVLLHLSDITTERAHREAVEQARDQLAHEARHDHLTGLPNRRALLDLLAQLAAPRPQGPGEVDAAPGDYAVLFLDLDGFKLVNDRLGHAAGDELLVLMARRLLRSVRPGDTVARLGGDEFVVLARNVDATTVTAIADRLSDAVRAPVTLRGENATVTCSIGIALSGHERAGSLLDAADVALYEAKEGGRDRWWLTGVAPLGCAGSGRAPVLDGR